MTNKRNSSPETGGAGSPATVAATKLQQASPTAAQAADERDPAALERCPLDEEIHTIFALVKHYTGHDFSSYKANTVMRRIKRRLSVNDVAGLGKYIALLRETPQEAHALCQDILIGVTSFFRDPEAFAIFQKEIIPQLFAGRDSDEPVRIWHACCATGEEVYSMAILIREYLDEERLGARVQVFASDIDQVAVAQARAGLYSDDIEADVGEDRLRTFFTRSGGRWQVTKQLREMIIFAHHSLIKDPPFSRLDLLVCRNFLIYLNPDMQKRVIALFHQALKPGGFLFLGAAETVGHDADMFIPVDKKWKIFARPESNRRAEMLFPFTAPVRKPSITGRPTRPAGSEDPGPGAVAEKLLVERYSPPCVVVNEKYEVVHVSTRANRFLEVPVGEPTRDILRMAREELRPALRAAIYKVFAENTRMVFRGVNTGTSGGEETVNVLVEPIVTTPSAGKLAMVIFEPAPPPALSGRSYGAEVPAGDEAAKDILIRQLEEQLRITHEQLQATSEQLVSTHEGFMSANEELMSINEEFQSGNEELQSTNEELETSKEELQALNEELVTVNAELQGKVEELNLLNNDMENLLTSSGIATIFLDRRLTIKRFTPAMTGIFNLIPADIGRPFRHLSGTIDWSGLARDAETVLENLAPIEREVTAVEDGRSFIMRVLPYRTAAGGIDGIVVTLIDITERKRMEEETVHLASFPQLNPNPVLEVESAGRVIFCNPATQKILESFGMDAADVEVFLPADLDCIMREWDRESETALHREINVRDRVYGETIFLTPQFEVARIYAFDITERKRAQEALAESEARVKRKLDSIISPEGDIGNLDLADIIDAPAVQSLVDDFYKLTGMPMGLLDIKGKVLVGVGWQDICTKFHRVNPETCANCIESDVRLSAGVPPGEYKIYKCKNNLWDVATPVMVGDRHFGNLFMGQFFFEDEPLDYELFQSQAGKYGFDEKEYIAALETVPRLSREILDISMAFFMKLADILSKLSYSNLKLARSLGERGTLMEELETRVRQRTTELATTVETLLGEMAERERAEGSLQRLNRLYAVLSETGQAIVRAADRETLFRDFCRIAVEHGGFLLSWVGLVDEESGEVRMVAASGATAYLDDVRITAGEEPTGEGPTGISIREGTYYICNNFQNDLCTRPWHEKGRVHGIHASASIALKEEERVIGALTLYAGEKDFFDHQHVELLRQMGADISFALDNLDREARRREAELALQTETLERLRATEELREKEQLLLQQSRLAAMGEMIGNIAHQWRQPLNTLGLIIQELPMNYELGAFTKEHLDASVSRAKQVIYHMSQTIDDFRNFFRPDKEKIPFKINDAVARTISLIEGSFREQRIMIAADAPDDIFIHGYPNEYSQVILNILVNARDAFVDRPSDLPRVVRIRLFRENNRAVLTITDNAGGIPEEILEKIFDPYFTTKGPDKGTGVGLFMSKTIIEKSMNGELSARNSGDGAEFRIEV
jgi:PAS domain S-box-containing protein